MKKIKRTILTKKVWKAEDAQNERNEILAQKRTHLEKGYCKKKEKEIPEPKGGGGSRAQRKKSVEGGAHLYGNRGKKKTTMKRFRGAEQERGHGGPIKNPLREGRDERQWKKKKKPEKKHPSASRSDWTEWKTTKFKKKKENGKKRKSVREGTRAKP